MTGVRGASVVEVDSKKYTTSGVWVVVTMRLKAHGGKPMRLSYAGLRDAAGSKYEQPSRFLAPAYGCELEPGIPVTADFIFEVPATVATGLSVEVAPGLDQRMGAMVRITIPQSAAAVLTWAHSTIHRREVQGAAPEAGVMNLRRWSRRNRWGLIALVPALAIALVVPVEDFSRPAMGQAAARPGRGRRRRLGEL